MNPQAKRDNIYRSPKGADAIQRRYRELLDQWPVPHQRQVVPTREGDTFVVSSGPLDAPPVLAIQGSGANTAMWLPQIAGWAPHLRVHAVDVIGEPGLSAPSRPPMNSERYARWLDDVMNGLSLTTASVIGMSLGGWFALDYAIRRPARVTRLVLLTPAGIGRTKYGVLLKSLVLGRIGGAHAGVSFGARHDSVVSLMRQRVRWVTFSARATNPAQRPARARIRRCSADRLRGHAGWDVHLR